MPTAYAYSLAVAFPALLGVLSLCVPRKWILPRVGLGVLGPAMAIVILALTGSTGGPVGLPWMPSLNLALQFNVDQLGTFFAYLIAGVGILIALYARAYFGPDKSALYRFYPCVMLFMTAMLGLVLSDNFLLLLLFWEMTSVSSFLLIGWERDDKYAVKNALQAFVVTGAGGLALLGGLVLLGVTTGCWSFSSLVEAGDQLTLNGATTAAFVLIFLGAAAKSAQWPLHFWLPGAMAAPTPVSAYLHSATMVKAGVYLLARFSETLGQLVWLWPYVLVPIGAITMVLGAYIALRKFDLKLIFAYTTVSQLGLLVCAYGLSAMPALEGKPTLLWDVTQILNHAMYKAPLFMLAGAVAHVAFTRDLRDLAGFLYWGKKEKLLTILLLLALYAMASGPGTLSLAAKEFFFYGVYHAWLASDHHPMLAVLLAAAVTQGALNVAISLRIARTLTMTEDRAPAQPPHDPHAEEERIAYEDYHAVQSWFWSLMLWAPAAIILSFQFIGGLAPALFQHAFGAFEHRQVYFEKLPSAIYLVSHPGVPLAMTGVAIFLGTLLAISRFWQPGIRDWHDKLFPGFYALATKGGGRVFSLIQTGNMRTYISVSLCTLVVLVILASGWDGSLRWPSGVKFESISDALPGYLVAIALIVSAIIVPFMRERTGQVMMLGTVGFAVAAMFYVVNAPDVALTQISVEIVSVILFLLVLSLLPQSKPATEQIKKRWSAPPRIVLAIAVGGMMGTLTYFSTVGVRPVMASLKADGTPMANLGEFFLRNSYEGFDTPGRNSGGGGNNVVNVILVDFRGFDTFGEIMVLSLAAIGVWTLLRPIKGMRSTRALRENLPPMLVGSTDALLQTALEHPHTEGESATSYGRRSSFRSDPLRVMTLVLVPLSLLYAIHIYFKGHQTPGGGFVAGLVAAIAMIVFRMAYGRARLRHMLRVRERTLIGVGLLLALATGLAPVLVGRPFLYSAFGYVKLPASDEYIHLASVMGFDLGVFLTVAGVVLGMINAVSEEAEER